MLCEGEWEERLLSEVRRCHAERWSHGCGPTGWRSYGGRTNGAPLSLSALWRLASINVASPPPVGQSLSQSNPALLGLKGQTTEMFQNGSARVNRENP